MFFSFMMCSFCLRASITVFFIIFSAKVSPVPRICTIFTRENVPTPSVPTSTRESNEISLSGLAPVATSATPGLSRGAERTAPWVRPPSPSSSSSSSSSSNSAIPTPSSASISCSTLPLRARGIAFSGCSPSSSSSSSSSSSISTLARRAFFPEVVVLAAEEGEAASSSEPVSRPRLPSDPEACSSASISASTLFLRRRVG